MAELKASSRNALASRVFGLPKQRKYPMNDREHAGKAKGRASEGVKKGWITPAQKRTIDAKANRILKRGR